MVNCLNARHLLAATLSSVGITPSLSSQTYIHRNRQNEVARCSSSCSGKEGGHHGNPAILTYYCVRSTGWMRWGQLRASTDCPALHGAIHAITTRIVGCTDDAATRSPIRQGDKNSHYCTVLKQYAGTALLCRLKGCSTVTLWFLFHLSCFSLPIQHASAVDSEVVMLHQPACHHVGDLDAARTLNLGTHGELRASRGP